MQITLDHLQREYPQLNADAGEGTFFALELQYIEKEWTNVDYPELKARKVIPIDTSAGPGAETVAYYMFDRVGAAMIVSDQATDYPNVEVFGTKFVSQIRSFGNSFKYSFQELRASQMAGRSIESDRLNNAHDLMMRLENETAFLGSAAWQLNGFLNFSFVPVGTTPSDGVGNTTSWANKTPDQMIRDLNLIPNTVTQQSDGIEGVDVVLLPLTLYNIARTTPRSAISDLTVLQWFLNNNPTVSVEWLLELETAGANGSRRAMGYRRNPAKVKMHIPQDFELFPPVYTGAGWKVNAHSRFGGCVFKKPFACVYFDGM